MSYYREPYRRGHGYAADYYDEHPVNRDYATRREYRPRPAHRPDHEKRRRASSVGGQPAYHRDTHSRRDQSRASNASYSQRPRYESESESDRSYRQSNRRKSTTGAPRDVYSDRSRSRDGSDSDDSRNHDHRGWAHSLRDKGGQLIVQAALPLLAAGAAEALRSRKQPGEWKGDKGKHVVKTAVTNGLMNRDPSKPHAHHILDTTVSGLKDGHPTRDEMSEIQRRAGGRTVSNAKKVAAAGAIAFAGMEIYDRYARPRSLKRSDTFDDNFAGPKTRSRSASDDFNRRRDSLRLDEDSHRPPRSQYTDDQSDRRRIYHGRQGDSRGRQYYPDEY